MYSRKFAIGVAICTLLVIICMYWFSTSLLTKNHPFYLSILQQQIIEESEDEFCGNWYQDYLQRLREIHTSSQAQYLISVAVEAGIADRITGLIAGFFHAFLLGRIFQMTTYQSLPSFTTAFDSPFLLWQSNYPEYLYQHIEVDWKGERQPDPRVNLSLISYMSFVNKNADVARIYSANLTNRTWNKYIFYMSNRGNTYFLFTNSPHKQYLESKGLTKENAFYCAFKFLFKPKSQVLDLIPSHTWDILKSKDYLKIGIHIRVGDHVFSKNDGAHVNQYKNFF